MREIKFRGTNEVGNTVYFTISDMSRTVVPDTLKHITQFTGLKDKNGVEIYEGDIVQEDDFYSVCVFIEQVAAFAFYPIELYNLHTKDIYPCIFEEHGTDTFFRNDVPDKYVEVVGNIHENADLFPEESA